MKKFNWKAYALLAFAVLCAWALLPFARVDQPLRPNHPASQEERATHFIALLSDDDLEPVASCTATAIGPHAIMTAQHCNDGKTFLKHIRIDASTHIYTILKWNADDRDHLIFLLNGPSFTNLEPVYTRRPGPDERVYFIGCGAEDFPCTVKHGKISNEFDPSDVDADQEIFYFTGNCIPGDSGAAVYGEDGAIVGLLTYEVRPGHCAGFSLAYTQQVYDYAAKYEPSFFDFVSILQEAQKNGNTTNNAQPAPSK